MSKYGNLIEQARKQENQKTGKPENRKTESADEARGVNLSIKVSESSRRHWAAEAKREGTTLTAVIIEALTERFGEPQSK